MKQNEIYVVVFFCLFFCLFFFLWGCVGGAGFLLQSFYLPLKSTKQSATHRVVAVTLKKLSQFSHAQLMLKDIRVNVSTRTEQ